MKLKTTTIMLGATFLLTACGGSETTASFVASTPPSPIGQTDQLSQAVDPISGFDSAIVNGYYAENTRFTLNDGMATQEDMDTDADMDQDMLVKAEFASYENMASSEVNYDNNDKREMSTWTCNGLAPG